MREEHQHPNDPPRNAVEPAPYRNEDKDSPWRCLTELLLDSRLFLLSDPEDCCVAAVTAVQQMPESEAQSCALFTSHERLAASIEGAEHSARSQVCALAVAQKKLIAARLEEELSVINKLLLHEQRERAVVRNEETKQFSRFAKRLQHSKHLALNLQHKREIAIALGAVQSRAAEPSAKELPPKEEIPARPKARTTMTVNVSRLTGILLVEMRLDNELLVSAERSARAALRSAFHNERKRIEANERTPLLTVRQFEMQESRQRSLVVLQESQRRERIAVAAWHKPKAKPPGESPLTRLVRTEAHRRKTTEEEENDLWRSITFRFRAEHFAEDRFAELLAAPQVSGRRARLLLGGVLPSNRSGRSGKSRVGCDIEKASSGTVLSALLCLERKERFVICESEGRARIIKFWCVFSTLAMLEYNDVRRSLFIRECAFVISSIEGAERIARSQVSALSVAQKKLIAARLEEELSAINTVLLHEQRERAVVQNEETKQYSRFAKRFQHQLLEQSRFRTDDSARKAAVLQPPSVPEADRSFVQMPKSSRQLFAELRADPRLSASGSSNCSLLATSLSAVRPPTKKMPNYQKSRTRQFSAIDNPSRGGARVASDSDVEDFKGASLYAIVFEHQMQAKIIESSERIARAKIKSLVFRERRGTKVN
jgi:hypothetical protein